MNKTTDFRSIGEGQIASLVLSSDNPLKNISNTRSIEAVIQRGQVYDKQALELVLGNVKEEVVSELITCSTVFKNPIKEVDLQIALDSLTTLVQSSSPDYLLDKIDLAFVMEDYHKNGEMEKLVIFGESMTVSFPKSMSAFTLFGDAYMQAGKYEKARQQLNKALKLKPDNERARQYLEELKELQ